MTDELERLRGRDEHLAQWAVGEIEAMRQRVTDADQRGDDALRRALDLETQLAALKHGQGDPVAEVVMIYPNVLGGWPKRDAHKDVDFSLEWIAAVPLGTKLYTSAPTIPDAENEAVRMFLMYYGGHSGVTIEGMRENLSLAGFDGCWPDWADDVGHLTKAGAQDWIKYLLFDVPKRTKANTHA